MENWIVAYATENILSIAIRVMQNTSTFIKSMHQFVCVMMNNSEIESSLKNLQQNLNFIQETWQAGEKREYLSFK